ncbi:protein kinase mTOR [Seminavis robusta]|uniref:non-specific serine/threonine protein kinase n=1 Tax=Seminavis robusta TaxID=568900 RepID=A0A9N8DJW7_9STRA|nr:protein kinase mTOR [Seminavis robusta]|eukprot:Sro182_g079310.1 protein kinase mTOR (3118) ;mRNA; f:29007-39273
MAAPTVFESSFFPDIVDGVREVDSPLTPINQKLRRKNVVAAASVSGPNMPMNSPTDPWSSAFDYSGLNDPLVEGTAQGVCVCAMKRRNSWAEKKFPTHTEERSNKQSTESTLTVTENQGTPSSPSPNKTTTKCPSCGKSTSMNPRSLAWGYSKATNNNTKLAKTEATNAMGEDPQHAQALLQSTPKLRQLSPASADMQQIMGRSRNILSLILPPAADGNEAKSSGSILMDYKKSLARERANQQAASELASLLFSLFHEMSLEDYGIVESEVFTSVFALVHDTRKEYRMAGLAALDALVVVEAPSADEEKKGIKFANALSKALQSAHGDFEFLSAVSKALGHMALRTTLSDFIESEIGRALEWLRTERSDRRLAAALSLKELAIHAPTAFHSKTSQSTLGQGGSNEFLDHIFEAIRDPQPIVRACAADALSQCLKLLVERQHPSLTGLLCQVFFSLMEGLKQEATKKRTISASVQHGSLLVASCMIAFAGDFMLPRFDEVCTAILDFTTCESPLIRLEVVRLIPRLARRCPTVFGRRYLDESLIFLIESASTPVQPRAGVDVRPSAYRAIGQLTLAMRDSSTGRVIGGAALRNVKIAEDPNNPDGAYTVQVSKSGVIFDKLQEIFGLLKTVLQSGSPETLSPALECAANLVQALDDMALPYISDLINDMFRAGLTTELINALHAIAQCVPGQQSVIENRLLQETSLILAGMPSARDICDPLRGLKSSHCQRKSGRRQLPQQNGSASSARSNKITINMADDPRTVKALVLSLQTLGSFGDHMGRVTTAGAVVPLLPFVQEVAIKYVSHPSSEVRRAAALTCCVLLHPDVLVRNTSYGGIVIEECLAELLKVAISDPSAVVRLCVVRGLDSRYDPFLSQSHHLQSLFLLLSDESLATRAAGLRLLGRLTVINPAPILPVLRRFLADLIVELQCGVETGRGREEATRLLVVFLKAKALQRLVHPVLQSLVGALPLSGAAPRLASAALEALGELALATGMALQPWVKDVVPHILVTMQDQSSTSKQRTSLMTLGQIAGSTGYVIRPYLDYPNLLSQATDVLPGTKRAPWALRREVIRCLGVLGALDPDRYQMVASKTRKGGAVGGAYFDEEQDDSAQQSADKNKDKKTEDTETHQSRSGQASANLNPGNDTTINSAPTALDNDDDLPAHLSMYEQYAVVVQPVSSLPPARRITPSDERFYPTVAIQALMRIFRDPSLAVHHGMVIQAIMFIFKSMGLRCIPYLGKVVPHMINAIRSETGPASLRESLFKQMASLSEIVREHLRPFIADIFDVVEQFWSSRHLGTIFLLVSKVAVGVPDEFRRFVPRLIRRLLESLEELQVAEWSTTDADNSGNHGGRIESNKLGLILSSINSLRGVLGDYIHMLVPALLKLSDSLASLCAAGSSFGDLHVSTLRTISSLLESQVVAPNHPPTRSYASLQRFGGQSTINFECGLSARTLQALVRLLRSRPPVIREVGTAAIETLCVCAKQLGRVRWHNSYHKVVEASIINWDAASSSGSLRSAILAEGNPSTQSNAEETMPTGLSYYNRNLSCLFTADSKSLSQQPALFPSEIRQSSFPESPAIGGVSDSGLLDVDQNVVTNQANRQRVNQGNLQRAWDVTQIASRDDWDQWMRTLSIMLLREAPSAALRATANLAHAYQPLARELFSAAFVCCWKELSKPYRMNLIHALETAFAADISPEILQALLNLAGFLEHDPEGGLPIDISILAELALKCRAYAKALHYKEREHRMRGANSCVEALISINRKLDLHEAALGILKAATMKFEGGRPGTTSPSDEFPTRIARHQSHGMFYSVIWSTDDVVVNNGEHVDLAERESWLAKLGSWTEALAVYEQKLKNNAIDFDAILGCMRCLDASGEWRGVLELAEKTWPALSGSSALGRADSLQEQNPIQTQMQISARSQKKAIRLCAQAAWRLGRWGDLEKFATELNSVNASNNTSSTAVPTSKSVASRVDFEGSFFSAVLHIHRKEWTVAAEAIDNARRAMDGRFTALMAESYNRAYPSMVTAQTLAEMEEIIELQKLEERSRSAFHRHPANTPNTNEARLRLQKVWRERLAGCRADAEVHSSILAVRSLVLGPSDDYEATLTLSELSRQAERFKLAERVLLDPLDALGANLDGPTFGLQLDGQLSLDIMPEGVNGPAGYASFINHLVTQREGVLQPNFGPRQQQLSNQLVSAAGGFKSMRIQHSLYFAYLKHLWLTDQEDIAIDRLTRLCNVVDLVFHCEDVADQSLRVACWLTLGEWKMEAATSPGSFIPEALQADGLSCFKRAVSNDSCGYRAWHAWALLNFRIAVQLGSAKKNARAGTAQRNHVIAAVDGFVTAINLGTKRFSASVQQDMLNVLTCLFRYGELEGVAEVINRGMAAVPAEAWLGVLPQLLARVSIKSSRIRKVLHPLLVRLGERHPQALMYPLSVLLKSPVAERKNTADSLLKSLPRALVEEALIVSNELIRVAILWLETWHEGLEDASRLYFGEGNVSGMLDLLLPLHEQLERGPETKREIDFMKAFGSDLSQAHSHIKEYIERSQTGNNDGPPQYDPTGRLSHQSEEAEAAINKAWDIYYTVFRRINKQLPSLTKLELDQCSPALSRAHGLELGVPGSYCVDGTYVKIEMFNECVQVITSKQRPRKITLKGSNGNDYVFLLKGHEDLRQDERVMQLFGLVNALLVRDPQTKKHDLKIQRYPITCLSTNCGLVGWVPNTDTFHSLIRDYRLTKRIALNLENKEMLKISADFDLLTVMQKVEVFTEALRRTTGKGNDIYEILWSRSTNSEEWLERRNKYTRSLAVMSMVGYILGLGDRHPSNLMLDKISGRVLHIDFGDCFEVAMSREKYPERVPFRLTRMLVKAMEVSGIEGSYRSTCERTMSVLRGSRDSLVAMLEAFVYDPLISWRLVDLSPGRPSEEKLASAIDQESANVDRAASAVSEKSSVKNYPIAEDFEAVGNPGSEVLDDEDGANGPQPIAASQPHATGGASVNTSRSHAQMYTNMQNWAANLDTDNRIASIAGERSEHATAGGSLAMSRIERSMRQKEMLGLLRGDDGTAHEEALNKKALKVIRRVQDKLTGTDFPDYSETSEPLDVPEQVQRLIVQATASENLCQLFIGWCAFW